MASRSHSESHKGLTKFTSITRTSCRPWRFFRCLKLMSLFSPDLRPGIGSQEPEFPISESANALRRGQRCQQQKQTTEIQSALGLSANRTRKDRHGTEPNVLGIKISVGEASSLCRLSGANRDGLPTSHCY